jgi:hypothetical protein
LTYFCLVECEDSSAPYFEMLYAECPMAAQEEAARLMAQHPGAVSAHVFTTDTTIATLYAPARKAA